MSSSTFQSDEPLPYWYVPEPNEMRDLDAALRKEQRAAKAVERDARFKELKDKGNDAFKNGDYQNALELYRDAIHALGHHRPKSSLPALLNSIQAFLKLKRAEEAEDMASLALSIEPKNIKARYRRGLARKAQNLLYAATLDFEAVLRVDPGCKEASTELESTLGMWEMGEGRETGNADSEDALPALSDPEESDDDDNFSDSEDWKHLGNGTPCRYYNQSRCRRGMGCHFSHGPDDRAFRDSLGRNVCIDFLIGQCKFGLDKCYFSHSTAYLHGVQTSDGHAYKWWEDEDFLKAARMGRKQVDSIFNAGTGRGRDAYTRGRGRGRGGCGRGGRGSGGRGSGRGGRGSGKSVKRWEYEMDEHGFDYGFTESDIEELLCQGVKPWDDDALDVLDFLSSY